MNDSDEQLRAIGDTLRTQLAVAAAAATTGAEAVVAGLEAEHRIALERLWTTEETLEATEDAYVSVLVEMEDLAARLARYETVILVPADIDATGRSDASGPLSEFLADVKGPATVRFPAGATYLVNDGQVHAAGLSDIILDFNGATLLRTEQLTSEQLYPKRTAGLRLDAPTNCVIRNLRYQGVNGTEVTDTTRLIGANGVDYGYPKSSSTGYGSYSIATDFAHAVDVVDAKNLLIEDCYIDGPGGDAINTIGSGTEGVTIRRVTVRRNGRQGVAIVAGNGFLVEHCDIESRRGGVDIEPDHFHSVVRNVVIRNNRLRTHLLAFPAGGRGEIHDVDIVDNAIVQSGTPVLSVSGSGTAARTGLRFERNVDLSTGRRGPLAALVLNNVVGATIANNVMPRAQGTGAVVSCAAPSHGVELIDNAFIGANDIMRCATDTSTWTESGTTT